MKFEIQLFSDVATLRLVNGTAVSKDRNAFIFSVKQCKKRDPLGLPDLER
jgi:hypothetical protein